MCDGGRAFKDFGNLFLPSLESLLSLRRGVATQPGSAGLFMHEHEGI